MVRPQLVLLRMRNALHPFTATPGNTGKPLALGLVLLSLIVAPRVASSQEAPAPSAEGLLVFLDCNAFMFCDFDHFRREIAFVNCVRDRQDADLHVLMTLQQTGGGGWEITAAFIGLRDHTGKEDTLQYVSAPTDTDAEVREELTQTLRLGLVRFVAPTAVGRHLQIAYRPPAAAELPISRAGHPCRPCYHDTKP